MGDKLGGVPNAFYDLIVFASSTVLFAAGIFYGCGLYQGTWYQGLGTANVFLIFAALIFLGYEYGRIAEAWSAVVVQAPLGFLAKHTCFLGSEDFLAKLNNVEESLNLDSSQASRAGGKWTIYFYAMLVNPKIGSDLLKRYAWEKLSRNSAFTFCALMLLSIMFKVLIFFGVALPFQGDWTFGTKEFTIISTTLTFFTYYEYYKRNCWNNDLLRKVIPVLYKAELLRQQNQEIKLHITVSS